MICPELCALPTVKLCSNYHGDHAYQQFEHGMLSNDVHCMQIRWRVTLCVSIGECRASTFCSAQVPLPLRRESTSGCGLCHTW